MTLKENTESILEVIRSNGIERLNARIQGTLQPETKYREDCYYCVIDHDMGATIHSCGYSYALGHCPCSSDCKNYISHKEALKIIKDYIEKRKGE